MKIEKNLKDSTHLDYLWRSNTKFFQVKQKNKVFNISSELRDMLTDPLKIQ